MKLNKVTNYQLYVVIGNAGKGRQTLWPKSSDPKAYTKPQAEKIIADLDKSQEQQLSGQISWHIKPLPDARKSVAYGQIASTGLEKLLNKHGIFENIEEITYWVNKILPAVDGKHVKKIMKTAHPSEELELYTLKIARGIGVPAAILSKVAVEAANEIPV